MPELVALMRGPDSTWVDSLQRIWERGDAVLPLDHRAPDRYIETTLHAMRPGAIIGADGQRRTLEDARGVEEGDAAVICTSGTTGSPKGVVLTHDAIEWAAYASMAAAGGTSDPIWLACLPLHHIAGFGVVTRALICGTGLIVQDGVRRDAISVALRQGATHVSLVPAALTEVDAAAFEVVLLGGSAIPADRPANSVATYGMTETCGGVVYDGLALNGTEVRIDTDGLVELRSASLLRCYRDGSIGVDDEGWFRTGDLGSLDPGTGHLAVWGRADDVILTGGEKVWPGAVEEILRADEAIAEVAVVGRADERWGERVTAVLVLRSGAEAPPLALLRERVKARLPAHCAPHAVEVVRALPRTASGKVRRTAL